MLLRGSLLSGRRRAVGLAGLAATLWQVRESLSLLLIISSNLQAYRIYSSVGCDTHAGYVPEALSYSDQQLMTSRTHRLRRSRGASGALQL